MATGISDVSAYLAQDFVASDSLDVVAREHGPAPPAEAVRIAGEVAAALDFAADANVLHGAMHPRDILVSPDDVRLTGLGIARALDKLKVARTIRRPYTAPERQEGLVWDRRADIFSLAAIVHELIWGRRITALGEEAASALTPVTGADLDALKAVFSRALAPNPGDRFESADEFASELKEALVAEDLSVEIDRPPVDVRSEGGRRVVVEEELRLPLDADLVDAPAVADEPEIIIERSVAVEVPPLPLAQSPAPERSTQSEADETRLHEETTRHEETRRHEETVPMVLPPVSPDRTVIYPKPPAAAARPPAPVKAIEESERIEETVPPATAEPPSASAVPPPSFSAFEESTRSSLWPLALSLAIGLAVGFAAGYATGGRTGTNVMVEASDELVPAAAPEAAPAPPPAAVPETEVRVPAPPPVVETPERVPPPPPPVSKPRPAPPQSRAARAPSRPPAQTRAPATSSSTSAMMVESRPSGASVRVDGRLVGKTPLMLPSMNPGDHSIVLEHDGYQRWASSVRIVAGTPLRVTASLER